MPVRHHQLLIRVSKTPKGVQFDRTFLTSVLTFVGPLVGLIQAQFPYFSDTLNQWLGPVSRIVR